MANWIVKTLDKKSIEEHQHFYKDGKTIAHHKQNEYGYLKNLFISADFAKDAIKGCHTNKDFFFEM